MDFYALYRKHGFDKDTLSKLIEVTPRTIQRWESNNNPPIAVIKLIQMLGQDFSFIGDNWKGFRVINGELVTPEDEFIRAGEIRSIAFLKQTISALKRENQNLLIRCESMEKQSAEIVNISDYLP